MAGAPDNSRLEPSADQVAADWVARRDRGLSAAEQDDYLQWLREDGQRRDLIVRHEATLARMKALARWQPALSREPDPDLFAPRRRTAWLPLLSGLAAAILLGLFFTGSFRSERPVNKQSPTGAQYLRINERQALVDGSIVELREGSRIEVAFSASERRVRLNGGEAHFSVAKQPDRPFIVEAGGVAVRAVGTAFNVRLDAGAVDVLVTEGMVHVESVGTPDVRAAEEAPATVLVAASQRTIVPRSSTPGVSNVVGVTPAEVREVLAWQAPRLQFHETPLAEAVAEFNRHNAHQLLLGDDRLGRIPIGGTFRVDNVEGFVRLLEVTLEIRGEPRGPGTTVLWRAR